MKRGLLLVILVVFMILPVVPANFASASLQHGVLGYVQNARDGTSPDGALVTFNVVRGSETYCSLTDTVGRKGNAKQPNWYAQDIGNCGKDWQTGDVVYVTMAKGPRESEASVALTRNGSDQVPTAQLSSSGLGSAAVILIVLITVSLIIFIICFFRGKKQNFKNRKYTK